MTDPLAGLNDKQQEVVLSTHGPLLVLAGAGSGKTRALTHRLAHMVQKNIAAPSELLAVTFTNKAAGTMKDRLAKLLDTNSNYLNIGTFHGLGARILREQANHLARSAKFIICDAQDSERLIKLAMKEEGISLKDWSSKQLKQRISQAKNSNVSAKQALEQADSPAATVAAKVYARYENWLAKNDSYDFDDLLLAPLALLEQAPDIRLSYQTRWPFISVDEYQDTNPIQERLLELLMGPDKHLCVVGDDYQAIYSWRGAKVDHILRFQKRFPEAQVIYLTQNYRSTPQILETANHVIAKNKEQMHKELWTEHDKGDVVRLISLPSDIQEAIWVREQIEQYVREGNKRQDCVVLYRTNAQSRLFEEQFLRYNIPYTIIGGFRFYERREVKDALAFLQLWVHPNSTLGVRRIIDALGKGVGPQTLNKWEEMATLKSGTLRDILIVSSLEKPSLRPVAIAFTSALEKEWDNVGDLLKHLLDQSGYKASLRTEPDGDERQENLDELINLTATYRDPSEFLGEVALLSDIDTLQDQQDRVTCMTLHAAKGLEFPRVFIVGLEEGLLPHMNSISDQASLEEERRLFYVGITRAQKKLSLSYASTRAMRGELVPQMPSRFLDELPPQVERLEFGTSARQNGINDWLLQTNTEEDSVSVVPAEVGEFVHHDAFGRGVVIGISGSTLTCIFEGHGVKTVSANTLTVPDGSFN